MDNVQTSQEQQPQALDVDEAADALLKRWEDADDQPSDQATEEATAQDNNETKDVQEQEDEAIEEVELDDEDEEIDPDEEEEEAEDQEEDDEEETVEVDDDTLIEISVEGETKQASIKDLKRLYGQEASLTRKSQEVAAQRKEAEDNIGKTDAILQRMVQKAEERYQPYSEVDMILASKNLDDADFTQLRKEAQDAHNDLKFIKEEANSFYDGLKQQQQAAMQDAAKEAVKVLEQDVPDWNNQLYDDIRSYAIGLGLPEEQVNNYVDPVVIKVLNKARLYDQAKQVTTTKKKRVAKKVLKSNKSPANNAQLKAKRIQDAEAKLAQSAGSDIDDIAEVLLKRWET
jgi:hypothetical protein